MEKVFAKVLHYFPKVSVAVLKCSGGALKVGEKIKVMAREGEFEQVVDSMQIEHEQVEKVGRGKEVAIRIAQKVREGDKVFKVKE